MPVITINGPVGSGAFEVGQLVAQELSLNYVDRLVLAKPPNESLLRWGQCSTKSNG